MRLEQLATVGDRRICRDQLQRRDGDLVTHQNRCGRLLRPLLRLSQRSGCFSRERNTQRHAEAQVAKRFVFLARRQTLPEFDDAHVAREPDHIRQRELRGLVHVGDDPSIELEFSIVPSISSALSAGNRTVPAGTLTQNGQSLSVQVGTPLGDLDGIRNIYLSPAASTRPPPAPVRLGDVAKVTQELAPASTLTRTNGKPSLGISVTMKADGNAVAISDAVRADLPELTAGSAATRTHRRVRPGAPDRAVHPRSRHRGLLGLIFAVW